MENNQEDVRKNNHRMKQYWLSYVAMIVAVIAIFFSLLRVLPMDVTTETFIGTIVGLIGLLTAFVVGFQIFSTIDIKDSVKDIRRLDGELKSAKKELGEAKADLEQAKSKLNEALDKTATELENFKYQIRAENKNAEGLAMDEAGEYMLAICYYMKGLYYSLKCNDEEMADYTVSNAILSLYHWDIIEPDNPFDCPRNISDKHPKDVALTTIDNVTREFADNEIYKKFAPQLLDIKKRLEQKIKEHESKETALNKKK